MNSVNRALRYLPERTANAVRASAALYGGVFQEIRLYRGGRTAIVAEGKTVRTDVYCSEKEFDDTVRRMCGNSLYAHADTIRDGYIFTEDGLRVGICGRAVMSGGSVELITDFSSLCIRLSSRRRFFFRRIHRRKVRRRCFPIPCKVYRMPSWKKKRKKKR